MSRTSGARGDGLAKGHQVIQAAADAPIPTAAAPW